VLADLIAPTTCVACGAHGDDLCVSCAEHVIVLGAPLCPRCGGPQHDTSSRCACRDLTGFDRARSLVVFAEPVRALTLRLKRRGTTNTAAAIGSLLAELVRRHELHAETVTFVPAVPGRGFDHAQLIARATARELGLPAKALLRRTGRGPRQADVPLTQRRANVRDRFVARTSPGRILLVDDVFTTGATAEACGLALRASGAAAVNVVTWARALRRRPP
jgi:predicted amidophosphoribosyltransferase